MRTMQSSQMVKSPPEVAMSVKARTLTVVVKGPRGSLTKSFRHLPIDIYLINKRQIKIVKWFGKHKELAAVRAVCSHIENNNMIKDVSKGFLYKMRAVYAHFSINVIITDDNKSVDIRNFLGEKYTRHIDMLPEVTFQVSGNKDEFVLEGNDIELVSRSAALIQQSTTVKRKDILKFLDGIIVSEKTCVVQE